MDTKSIARRLFDFSGKTGSEEQNNQVSEQDLKVVIDILNQIGFEVSGLRSEKITVWLTDIDGSKIRPEGVLNDSFPFIALDENGDDDVYVTGWLVQTLDLIRVRNYFAVAHGKIISEIQGIIKLSAPLEPILLTSDGDFLIDKTPNTSCIGGLHGHTFHRPRTRDTDSINKMKSRHRYCGGSIDFGRRTTKDKIVLLCRSCGLRLLIPKEIDTFGKLRKLMKSKLSS